MAIRVFLCVMLAALTLIGQSITNEIEVLNRAAGTTNKLTPAEARQRSALLHQLIAIDPQRAIELARLETPSETRGTLIATVADDFERRKSKTHWALRTKEGLVELHFAGSAPETSEPCGRTAKVAGVRVGTRIAVSGITVEPSEFEELTQAQCSALNAGAHNVAVLLLQTSAATLPASVNATSLNSFLFASSGQSLNTYWNEVSYGRVTAMGSVFGPFTLSSNYTCDQREEILAAALTAANATVDFTQYHHLALVFPNVGSCAIGVATVGCRDLYTATRGDFSTGVSWLRADYLTRVDAAVALAAHELGHNMGLDHANTMTYSTIPLGNPASATFSEYGDYFSAMGLLYTFNGSTLIGHYGAPHKARLGWFNSPNVVQVTATGTYTIAPIESASTGPQVLRIRRTFDADLWIEYRRNAGYNATTATVISDFNGAWIRYQSPALAFNERYTNLLNFHPGTGVKNSLLRVGETWQDPSTTLRLRVDSADNSGLTITVTDPPAVPIPTLTSVTTSVNPPIAYQQFTLTVNGSGFDPATAQIVVGSTAIANSSLTVKTSTQLQGSISRFPGAHAITARNGATGIASNAIEITVAASSTTPVVSSITPNPVASGTGTFTLNGSNFNTSTALVVISGTTITPTSRTATQLVFTTSLAPGSFTVAAKNGASGTLSNAITLTASAPVLTSISSSSVPSGSNTFTLTGSNFNTASAQVEVSSVVLTPSSLTATQAVFTTNLPPGSYAVLVRNGSGGTASNTLTLTVNAPAISTITPDPGTPGSGTYTINGVNFNPATALVEVDGSVITPSSRTGTQVIFTATLTAGVRNVQLRNGAGGTASNTLALTITAAPADPVITSITPNPTPSGSSTFTVTGSNFNTSNAQVEIGPTVYMPSSRTATQLVFTANLPSAAFSVRVRNGSGGTASNVVTLTIEAPDITVITPNPAPSGINTFAVTGTNFHLSSAVVEVDATVMTPSSITSTQLSFSSTLAPGNYNLLVRNGTGGTVSKTLILRVNAPVLSAIAPNPATSGANTFTLTGTNFNPASVLVEIGSTVITPSSRTATQVVFNTTLAAGSYNVAVRNGIGGTVSNTLSFAVNDPAPTAPVVSSVTPNQVPSGSGTFTINGSNFDPVTAQVEIGSTVVIPTSRTSTQLVFSATLPASAYTVLVRNGTGGPPSNTVSLAVNAPSVSAITPNPATTASTTYTVTGTDFHTTLAQVEIGGTVVTPSSRSATQLTFTATLPVAAHSVVVRNGSGGSASGTVTLTVTEPVNNTPTLSSISPNPGTAGSGTYTLGGSNFNTSTALVEIDGSAITPSSRTATQLVITTSLSAGSRSVLVRNGSGGPASGTVTLTVTEPVNNTPAVTGISPNPGASGSGTFVLSGSNFNTSTAQVEIGTTIVTPASRTSTQLVFSAPLPPGSYSILARNGSGGPASNSVTLTVNGPAITGISPNPATSGSNTFTITGTNFNTLTAQVEIGTTVITPASRTATQLVFSTNLAAGSHNVLVRNGTGGAASSALTLTVNNPAPSAPTVSSVTPNPVTAGSNTFTISGSNFNASTALVEIGTSVITPSSRSTTQVVFSTTLAAGSHSVLVRNGSGGLASNTVSLTVSAPVSGGSHFVPITPCRAVDTRNTSILPRDSSREFTFGTCSIPSNATALALNVTLVPSGQFGFLSIWPAGQPQPVVSTMNSLDGRIKANAAIVGVGTGGAVSVYVTDPAHVLLDVNGYFVPAGTSGALAFYPLAPCRVVDTRETGGTVGARQTRRISGGCLPSNAQAYSLNVTSVPPAPLGFLTLWPDGSTQPTVSTLNNLTGTIVANAAILRSGTGGAFNAYVTDASQLVVDINGYFAPPGLPGALAFYPSTPCRIFDTRNANGPFGGPAMASNGTRSFTVPSSSCGIPTAAQAYVTNATVLPSGVFGFLTMWQGEQARPTVSTLNAVDAALTSNAAIIPAGPGGAIQIYTSNATHMILDISGYFAP